MHIEILLDTKVNLKVSDLAVRSYNTKKVNIIIIIITYLLAILNVASE